MDRETEERFADLANALIIVVGTMLVELGTQDAADVRGITGALRRKAFEAEETGAPPNRADIRWIRYIADAVDAELGE